MNLFGRVAQKVEEEPCWSLSVLITLPYQYTCGIYAKIMMDKLREKVTSGSNKPQFFGIPYWLIHMDAGFWGYLGGRHIDRGLRQACVKFCSCSIQLEPSGNLDIYTITGSYYLDCFPKANFDSVRLSKLSTEQNNYYARGLARAKSLKCKPFV